MGHYTVGKRYAGRVVFSSQENVSVELEPGVVGRVLDLNERDAFNNGEVRLFEVIQNDSQGILLRLVTPTPSEDVMKADTTSWGNWANMPIGHDQAMTAMVSLLNHTNAFREKLETLRKNWEKAKAASQSEYEYDTSDARRRFEDKQRGYIDNRDHTLKRAEWEKNQVGRIVDQSDLMMGSLSEFAQFSADSSMKTVSSKQKEVLSAINSKVTAAKELCNLKIAEAEREYNAFTDEARKKQIDRDTQAEQDYEREREKIYEACQKEINDGFNKATISAYQSEIKSVCFDVANYECPSDIPEYVSLGTIGVSIPNEYKNDKFVIQAVEAQTSDFGGKDNEGNYVLMLPYAQRLSDGISLLIRYSPENRSAVQKAMQPMLLKLFMSFPAGKLEATMIDPLELGASFPDIPKLVQSPKSKRIIDTKIWSEEKDIEKAITTLRQRLENMTQAYGDDQASRLKKEVIRALVVTDFPVGFNDNALKDLHAIVRNSASLGICVLISANNEELERLKQRNESLVTEITQNVLMVEDTGNPPYLTVSGYDDVLFALDDMQDVLNNKDTIISTIGNAVEHAKGTVEVFDNMFREDFFDSNNWFMGNHDEIAIPIGIRGANSVVKMVLGRSGGSTEHHALIAGQTGAGKSTLLHTLIMSTLISYSPDEVQMYILDFKEGVEFYSYTKYRLPSLRVVAINSEREFGLSVLQELCTELEIRAKHFNRYDVNDINDYMNLSDVPKVPKLLLIFDEVQELFRSGDESDSITRECLSCINKLVMQGRAMGIHVILACQDFRNCSGLEAYFSQMAIRIAVRGSEESAASILSADNDGIRTLQNQPPGAAIYNGGGGVSSANTFFQTCYLADDKKLKLLSQLDAYFKDPEIAPLYENQETRILLTDAEKNNYNCFNKLILEGENSIEQLGASKDGYGLLLGQNYGKKSLFIPELCPKEHDNLLIVCKEERVALSLFMLSAMSILYEELHTPSDKSNVLIYIVDLFAGELLGEECSFDYLESRFPKQIKVIKKENLEEFIESLYETFVKRSEGVFPSSERLFLLFFGINRARNLKAEGLYDEAPGDNLCSIEMLKKIIAEGPNFGVNSIIWGESLKGVENKLGEHFGTMFDKRIAYELDENSMDILVAETETEDNNGHTAVYLDNLKDIKNTHFRPYDVPAETWIERYSEVYNDIVNN